MKKKVLRVCVSILSPLLIMLIVLGHYVPPRGFINAETKSSIFAESSRMGPIGVTSMSFDSVWFVENDSSKKKLKHFISFYNLYIKAHSKLDRADYLIENENPFILKKGTKERLPFYFDMSTSSTRGSDRITTTVMLPVSKSTKSVLTIIWIMAIVVLALCVVAGFFGGLWALIENIASGSAFSIANISVLRNICYICFGIAFIYVLASILTWFVMKIIYPDAFGLDPEVFFSAGKIILVGIFFFALYKAFKKGYKLQSENDLTV